MEDVPRCECGVLVYTGLDVLIPEKVHLFPESEENVKVDEEVVHGDG